MLEEQVKKAIDEIRPQIQAHGGDVEFVEIQEGIKLHHKAMEQVSPSSITGIMQISEYFVSKLNYAAIPGMNALLSPPLAAHISENVMDYKALIQDLPEEMSKAKDLYKS